MNTEKFLYEYKLYAESSCGYLATKIKDSRLQCCLGYAIYYGNEHVDFATILYVFLDDSKAESLIRLFYNSPSLGYDVAVSLIHNGVCMPPYGEYKARRSAILRYVAIKAKSLILDATSTLEEYKRPAIEFNKVGAALVVKVGGTCVTASPGDVLRIITDEDGGFCTYQGKFVDLDDEVIVLSKLSFRLNVLRSRVCEVKCISKGVNYAN